MSSISGMTKMKDNEMKLYRGGVCNSNYGYYFCCPSSASKMVAQIKKYENAGQHAKASKYIQFCYEVCGYTG